MRQQRSSTASTARPGSASTRLVAEFLVELLVAERPMHVAERLLDEPGELAAVARASTSTCA